MKKKKVGTQLELCGGGGEGKRKLIEERERAAGKLDGH